MLIGLCLLLASCSADKPEIETTLHACAAMPSPRASAACAVTDGRVYVFAGRDSAGTVLNDLWVYDAATDRWTDLGTTPLKPRVNATACVHGKKVYMGLGFYGKYGRDTSYLQDWWEYTPDTRQWRQLSDYPNSYTNRTTAFTGNGELYVGYGFSWNYRRDMFRYDITANRWDSIDVEVSFHGYPTRSFGGTGCTCGKRHFMGTGYYRHSLDWWAEFDGQHWTKRTAVPGPTRTLAASAATDEYIYLAGGLHYGGVNTTGEVLRDIRRYDPQTDRWTYIAVLSKGLMNHLAFTVGKRVFVGLGETEDELINPQIYWFEE